MKLNLEALDGPVIDARDLEPPEPFVRTMAALDDIGPGQSLHLVLPREPYPLYNALAMNGFTHDTSYSDDGFVVVRIFRK
ncbi:hypothetical protein OTERR_08290 [Oryzomicrobium terrae]|uniref:DUF2249 domain-containing protein n=1 Tax=Oryzomicrobium terrae TaxID=1735038 RepID=A0A5C1E6K7_9RHOO|nr:DUF2249 domain-containing protein [Oryzomicrobium terrae]QEL64305.1 hypothetical protein OTERR_08290 [Oryzomicrobium terrae]